MSTISKNLFEELKNRCVNCVNQPNVESIELLREFVAKCDNEFINSLYQYSIFPLRLIIANFPKQPNGSQKLLESCVNCLSLILQKSSVNRFDIFSDIFANLFHLIDANNYNNNNDQNLSSKLNEDLLLSVIECSKSLIQSCDNTILEQLISQSFRPQFGHSIHILLSIAVNEKYSLLKIEAINTITCLLNKCQLIKSEHCVKTDPEDVIAYFLPGISINVSKLITSDDKLNRQVINNCLTLLSNTIVFVFKSISTDSQNQSQLIDSKELDEDLNNRFIVIRDQKWLDKTCDKLSIIFKSIVSCLISHQNWVTRQSLALFVIEILSNCSPLFINNCLSVLIPVPLTYLNDDYEQIRLECDSFITKFSKNYVNSESSKTCLDLIQDEIYLYITRLPRIIRTSNERQKTTAIYLLYGYLKCLDINGINDLLYSPQHKERLFQCFIDIFEFNYHGIQLLEQVANTDCISYLDEEQLPHKWVKKNFSFLNDEKAVIALTKCCQLVGNSGQSQLLSDYLIESLRQSKLNPSIVFVSNLIISNTNCSYNDIEEFVDFYLSNISTTSDDQTIEQMNKDILRQCLLVEGLAAFVKLYDLESSHIYLMKCLFPLLEKAGSSNLNVFQSSCTALTRVSTHFSYNSISNMISSNIDYLINSISINLKHFLNNQNVPIVIKVMLKYSDEAMLPYFVEPINQIISLIDCYYHSRALPLMQVLSSFVSTLSYCYLSNDQMTGQVKSNQRTSLETRAQNVADVFQEFLNNKTISQDLENESEANCDEELENDGEEVKKELPFYVLIIENILERCQHLMSSSDSKVRLIIIDIVIQSLLILKPFQDQLLPIAHKLWSPLVERFQDKDVIVIKRAFSCLLIMSETCGDFIRARTVKEVLPKIQSFLKAQSELSFKKDKASAYRFTIAYQFQIDILSAIGSIAVNLDLNQKDLWQLIVQIIPYLNTLQPSPLQESAIVALKKIAELDANSVFYYLKMTYSPSNVSHNDNKTFPTIKFGDNKKEYMKNVTKILNDLSLIYRDQ